MLFFSQNDANVFSRNIAIVFFIIIAMKNVCKFRKMVLQIWLVLSKHCDPKKVQFSTIILTKDNTSYHCQNTGENVSIYQDCNGWFNCVVVGPQLFSVRTNICYYDWANWTKFLLWCTYTEHLMHEISDLMQGFNFFFSCKASRQYFVTILW